jgi:membrane protease YdiL (CAAX protease family)
MQISGLLVSLVVPMVLTWLYLFVWPGPSSTPVLYSASKIFMLVVPMLWVWGIMKETPRLMKPTRKGLGLGVGFGLVVTGVMWVIYLWLRNTPLLAGTPEQLKDTLEGFNVGTPLAFAVFALFISLVNSSMEEYYWRWFLFGEFKRLKGPVVGILISSGFFAMHHVMMLQKFLTSADAWIGVIVFSALISVGGAVWCWITHKSGSVFGAWISHLIIDAGIMLMGADMLYF